MFKPNHVRFQVLTEASMKFRFVFWDEWLIRDDGGSTYLWNAGLQLFYTAVHPRIQFWTSSQIMFAPRIEQAGSHTILYGPNRRNNLLILTVINIFSCVRCWNEEAVKMQSDYKLCERLHKWITSYPFSTSALDGGEWSASRLGRALAPGKGPPVPTV
jgi:hypothetical protein